jgi:hypothetical protein
MNNGPPASFAVSRVYRLPWQMALTSVHMRWRCCSRVCSEPAVWSVQFSRNGSKRETMGGIMRAAAADTGDIMLTTVQ